MNAENNKITLELIEAAQKGCETSLSHLSREVKRRVSALLFRMTMDYHLTEDLTQETMLELVRSLERLEVRSVKSFWGWLYRTAVGKMQHHNRIQGNKRIDKKTSFDTESLSRITGKDVSPLYDMIKKESIDTILSAMYGLKAEYRGVLSLRCIEGLSYTQIALIMGGTPLRVRMLYRHAKVALQKQLSDRDLGRSHFFQALSVFAVLTASPTDKFATVEAAGLDAVRHGIRIKTSVGIIGKIAAAVITVALFVIGVNVINNYTNRDNQISVPEPPYDDSIRQIYDDPQSPYIPQVQVLSAVNPDGGDWQCFPWLDSIVPAITIGSVEEKPKGTYLVMPKGHSVEYLFSGPLVDKDGYDLAVQVWAWGQLPDIFLTDGAGKQCRIYPVAYRGQYLDGFMALAFDLAEIKPDFEPKTIHIVGADNEGPYGGCSLGVVAAHTAEDTAN